MVKKHSRTQRTSKGQRRSSKKVRLTDVQKVNMVNGGVYASTPTGEKRPKR